MHSAIHWTTIKKIWINPTGRHINCKNINIISVHYHPYMSRILSNLNSDPVFYKNTPAADTQPTLTESASQLHSAWAQTPESTEQNLWRRKRIQEMLVARLRSSNSPLCASVSSAGKPYARTRLHGTCVDIKKIKWHTLRPAIITQPPVEIYWVASFSVTSYTSLLQLILILLKLITIQLMKIVQ